MLLLLDVLISTCSILMFPMALVFLLLHSQAVDVLNTPRMSVFWWWNEETEISSDLMFVGLLYNVEVWSKDLPGNKRFAVHRSVFRWRRQEFAWKSEPILCLGHKTEKVCLRNFWQKKLSAVRFFLTLYCVRKFAILLIFSFLNKIDCF